MMKSLSCLILGLLGVSFLTGCGQPDPISAPHIELVRFDHPLTDQKKSGCDVHLTVPVYTNDGLPQSVVDLTNINLRMELFGRADKNDKVTFQTMVSECEQSLKSDREISNPKIFTDDLSVTTTLLTPYRLSMTQLHYTYMGGAHGLGIQSGVIMDLNTGKRLGLRELLKPEAIANYVALEKTALLKQAGADLFDEPKKVFEDFLKNPPQQLNADQEKNTLLFNPNVYLTDKGFMSVYNPYDISPYAIGSIEVLIPWNQIKLLLK